MICCTESSIKKQCSFFCSYYTKVLKSKVHYPSNKFKSLKLIFFENLCINTIKPKQITDSSATQTTIKKAKTCKSILKKEILEIKNKRTTPAYAISKHSKNKITLFLCIK